jgi:hypothetical protein
MPGRAAISVMSAYRRPQLDIRATPQVHERSQVMTTDIATAQRLMTEVQTEVGKDKKLALDELQRVLDGPEKRRLDEVAKFDVNDPRFDSAFAIFREEMLRSAN